MTQLAKNQQTFILKFFNVYPVNQFSPGWESIANKLLDHGTCIVAGSKCIWEGGIGNFITTSEVPDAVGCIKYEFDLDNFISSKWFSEELERYLAELQSSKKKFMEKLADLELKITDIWNLKN